MGNCSLKQHEDDDSSSYSVNNFVMHYVIGQGAFGKVWKVQSKKTKQMFALKEMSKAKIISKKSANSVINERQLLTIINSGFFVNMILAFQDRENLYLVMDLMTGGDMRYHLIKNKKFTEAQTKFFIACILSGLEYIHQLNILHRDIKPENIILDEQGYLRITDLGIARQWKPDNQADTSGTPGYMAPEVMCRHNHGIAVDYYALGIITYECMIGKRPYSGITRQEVRDQILAKQIQLKKADIPEGWSLEAADFINRLIQRKPQNRLGENGPEEVKSHPWFKNYPWQKLKDKELEAPYLPSQNEEHYHTNIKQDLFDQAQNKQDQALLRRNSVQGYAYDANVINNNLVNSQKSSANLNRSTRPSITQKQQPTQI